MVLIGGGVSNAYGDTFIIPLVTVGTRYDSNVFLIPKTNGFKREDIVSTIVPQINVLNRGDLVQTSMQIAGIGEKYENNPGLDYFGGSGRLALNLDRLVQRYTPNLTLTISDGAFYTPNAPAFSTPAFGEDPSALGRGIQVVRVNTFSNSAAIVGTYRFTPATTFRVGYNNQMIRFGHSYVDTGGRGLVDTNTHTLNAGPFIQVNVSDTIGVYYTWQRVKFLGGQAAGLQDDYEAHGGNLSWQRIWIPEFRTNTFAGATVITSGGGAGGSGSSGSQSPNNLVVYTGGFSAFWSDLVPTTVPQNPLIGAAGGSGGFGQGGSAGAMMGGASIFGTGARTTAVFSYSAGVYPGYYGAGVPLLSHVVTTTGTRRLGQSWAVVVSGDYARNDSLISGSGEGSNISFQAYGGRSSLTYMVMTGLFVSLTGDYHKFEGEGLALGGALSGAQVAVDRYVGMISLTKMWLP